MTQLKDNMSNIEKIRQEIERLMKETEDSQFDKGERYGLKIVLEFIDSLPEEKPSEDLEEAAARYERESRQSILSSVDIVDAFIAGAEWQKEQMMKDAVEGEIGYWNQRGLSIRLDQSLERLGYDEDTKVKIIIVKKKEE